MFNKEIPVSTYVQLGTTGTRAIASIGTEIAPGQAHAERRGQCSRQGGWKRSPAALSTSPHGPPVLQRWTKGHIRAGI